MMPSKSKKQHDLMVAACKSKRFADKVKISQDVACEFVEADREAGLWQPNAEDFDAISQALNTLSEKARNNVTIVSKDDARTPYMLHITKDKNPKYIPRIGTKQASSEDRTVPRVTVADTIVGCILGYYLLPEEVFYSEKDFHNGVYIRKIPFEYCLKPNNKLVYDHSATNEHWLIPYNRETTEYKSEKVGTIIISKIEIIPVSGKPPEKVMHLQLELKEDLWLSDITLLEAGYWEVVYQITKTASYAGLRNLTSRKIDKSQYVGTKEKVAVLLSSASTNHFSSW
jgi:hypothetical protein